MSVKEIRSDLEKRDFSKLIIGGMRVYEIRKAFL